MNEDKKHAKELSDVQESPILTQSSLSLWYLTAGKLQKRQLANAESTTKLGNKK